ncbi:hypothetical protein [Pseudomonas brassicacearum]|uniref:hypothetical protein n=1 Tax=Pseudomonas brassicacearum TaxID=930166 RepID=UPI0011CEAF2A|nr:hypothetical protein [Pseudomonas brassicacearum]
MNSDASSKKGAVTGVTKNRNNEKSTDADGISATGEARGRFMIRAKKNQYWADIELDGFWRESGGEFAVKTVRYRSVKNGRREGNIKLGLVSKEDTGWEELTGNAIQDGEWHDFEHELSVKGDAKEAIIHFNFIYDRKGDPDINMTGADTSFYNEWFLSRQ